jgi:hypothetical protein
MRSLPSLRTLCIGFVACGFATLFLSASLALAAPSANPDTTVTIPPDTPTLVKQGGQWVLRCPVDCMVVTVNYGHGEKKTFCDCDGDGAMDEGCAIWLHTGQTGDQRGICKPGCPEGEMCTLYSKSFPNGAKQKVCECDSPFCAGEFSEIDDDRGGVFGDLGEADEDESGSLFEN